MGLKSGSRDAGLGDTDDSSNQSPDHEGDVSPSSVSDTSETTADTAIDTPSASANESETDSQRPTIASLPYKLRRETVNEGREQVPFFLREDIIESGSDLQETLEERLDEGVYKSDYREAAMIVAQRNPDLVADVLREWGYDLDTA